MGQSWQNCQNDVKVYVQSVVEMFKSTIPNSLDSIIIHGSLAMGSFYPPKSDIDLLIITNSPLSRLEQERINKEVVAITDNRPMTGFLEFSVILDSIALSAKHPIAHELHFGEEIAKRIKAGRFDYENSKALDPDLAAHFMVARTRGISLYGKDPASCLGKVKWQDYLDSVLDDLKWILDDKNILTSPFYGVLNSLRVLQMLENGEGTVSSKEEGGLWGLENIEPYHRPVAKLALDCYRSNMPVSDTERQTNKTDWPEEDLLKFKLYVHTRVSKLLKSKAISTDKI